MVGAVFGWLSWNESAENIARFWFAGASNCISPLNSPNALSAVEALYRILLGVKCLRAVASVPTAALLGCFPQTRGSGVRTD
jgi:hypothetical protein